MQAVSWVDQARDIARQLYEDAINAGALPVEKLQQIESDPALFWLRGEEQPHGIWQPAGTNPAAPVAEGQPGSEFPASATSELHYGIIELLDAAKAVHHLLDMAGVPQGYGLDTRNIDARVLVAVIGMRKLRERLARISAWHSRETSPAGMVGDYCIECGNRWPCKTRRAADRMPPLEPLPAIELKL